MFHNVKHYKKQNRIENKTGPGKLTKSSDKTKRFILRNIKKILQLGALKVIAKVHELYGIPINSETVRSVKDTIHE